MSSTPAAAPNGFLAVLWSRYLLSLKERPIPTKLATSVAVNGLSKVIAQMLAPDKRIDVTAVAKQSGFAFVSVPLLHYYYGLIDKLFAGKDGAWVLLTQLFIDQAIFSPFFYVVYYIYMGILNGTLSTVPRQIRKELVATSIDSAKFWTVVQFFNFKFVPTELRILFGNVCNLVWSVYWLSTMNKAKDDKEDKKRK